MSVIAFVGATSQIAKDLIRSFAAAGRSHLLLYVRNLEAARTWVAEQKLACQCSVHGYQTYGELPHDVVINFVGVGDPQRAADMGESIFEITARFDDMVLTNLIRNPERRYLFLSSGAAYGNAFAEPVNDSTQASIAINNINPHDYYATAKLHAEVRHRAMQHLPIIDLRVFNIFSRTQSIESRFLITDIIRAIRDKRILQTTDDYIVRDFLHPSDFFQLVQCLLKAPPVNCAVDCYSREPIGKTTLLSVMSEHLGLRYEVIRGKSAAVNATGLKPHYYSLNRRAAAFGYQPVWTSLDCVLEEASAMLRG